MGRGEQAREFFMIINPSKRGCLTMPLGDNNYDDFAWLYYQHWTDFAQEVWPILEDLLLPALPPRAQLIDLCCGTGNTAANLSDRGYRVTGIDHSEKMLAYARNSAPHAVFLCQDARSMMVRDPVMAVVSLFDSLNHMMTPEDLRAVFFQVYRALEPGGLFFFDINTMKKYEARWSGSSSIIRPDHVAAIDTTFDLRSRVATFTAAVFREEGTRWIRSDVSLTQRAYRLSDIEQWLKDTGFKKIQAFDGITISHNARFWGREFLLAVKPAGKIPMKASVP
jgi:ubiquinone/menaquinone biosynthesis C-methylase UbiE